MTSSPYLPNKKISIHRLMLQIELISTMYKPIKKSNCQSLGVGFGFTSGLCNSQDDTINAIHASKPRKQKNTYQKLVLHFFETTSSFTSSQEYKWINNKIWHDKKHPNRRRDYAQQISKNNTAKGIYFASTIFWAVTVIRKIQTTIIISQWQQLTLLDIVIYQRKDLQLLEP